MCSCIFLFSKAENRLQWIQKLGRARAENSKAFIFENNVNEEETARREMKRISRDPSMKAVEEDLINVQHLRVLISAKSSAILWF
mmetsp:Transcript_10972/g.15213  ORF Transcript_10972/g.15213 Transcript_10972/m.15213 type:complete len:85 (+) Transcript_10972:76-330(+)